MEPPGITRHRRPFLAPLWVTLLAAVAVGVIAWAFYRDASTTVVILLHSAEKTPGTIDDPPLSPEGEERAQRLAQMFAGPAVGTIDAIYASDDRRAQQTAAPLAERLHRVPALLNPAEARAGAARALHEHAGGTVLMIVSGPALLQVLRELAGGAPAGAPDDPNLAYIISIPSVGHAHVVRLRM